MASTINASTASTTGLVQTADASGILQLQSNGTTALTVNANANVTVNTNLFVSGSSVQPLVSGTAQNTTSGTNIDFTGIPSWVKRITVMFNGVSTNGSSQVLVQVGAGSITTTGYSSIGFGVGSTPTYAAAGATNGFVFQDGMASFVVVSGSMVITSFGGNTWTYTATTNRGTNAGISYGGFGAGSVTLSGTLDRLRLTTANGTDAFDAGSINILYE
jgi:hypothetical protein